MTPEPQLIVYHIPVCPFSQRLEILLDLKNCRERVDFRVIDITQPRPDWLLEKTRGTTSLPVLELEDGSIIKESLVILDYLEQLFPEPAIAQADPYKRAVEGMLCAMANDFGNQGYGYIMNQNVSRRESLRWDMLKQFARINDFLLDHNPDGVYLFDDFGWAETVFTPLLMRFWFLDYYENFELPVEDAYARVSKWREACLKHPAAQQVTRDQIITLYYDYAQGAGNGALLPGRTRSSFVLEPDWRQRPLPPRKKYADKASDEALGLLTQAY